MCHVCVCHVCVCHVCVSSLFIVPSPLPPSPLLLPLTAHSGITRTGARSVSCDSRPGSTSVTHQSSLHCPSVSTVLLQVIIFHSFPNQYHIITQISLTPSPYSAPSLPPCLFIPPPSFPLAHPLPHPLFLLAYLPPSPPPSGNFWSRTPPYSPSPLLQLECRVVVLMWVQ